MCIVVMRDIKTRLREIIGFKLTKLTRMSDDHEGPPAELFVRELGGEKEAVGF